ncbi:DUF4139 domain-containing protein [Leptospira sp. GIMC2001]|uniref:DUF4139 domain-containing protein n=1 Tax=Leptospira sp. GIMC2001 TaxID=1513297 RepID=UPI00234A3A5F|nr:hypothetical protein [Leptospira sp. GIMC2001]WCL49748.1 hypothetical protein O4O04_02700 [Leptospira sp. GIMC2001]
MPISKKIIFGLFVIALSQSTFADESSSASDRKTISVTIYNGGMGLVRETRNISLPKGRSTLRYEDVASSILPQTVRVSPAKGSSEFDVFEQNFEYDLISNQRLLEKYVGKEVTLITTNSKSGEQISTKAKLIAYNDGPVYEIGNTIALNHPGRVVVSSIPENLFSKPTLVWELSSKEAGSKSMEVSYQTGGMNWSADYNLNINDKEDSTDIQSWVTLSNSSGAAFPKANLQLVAGKIQLISSNRIQENNYQVRKKTTFAVADGMESPAFEQENLSEYYLYSLDQPTDIGSQQTKQVQLFSEKSIKIEKKFIFENLPMYSNNEKKFNNATVRYDIHNTKKNNLGRPLPAGTVRLFKADSKGRQQLLGEDSIDHTPNNEWVRVSTGSAFDVVANGRQMSFEQFKISNGFKASYEVDIRNRKKEAITVRFYANTYGEWKITNNSHSFEKESQYKVYFDIKIPADGVEKLKYTIENQT